MKTLLAIIAAVTMTGCYSHSDPVPHIGDRMSSDYYSVELWEETPEYTKYALVGWSRVYLVTVSPRDPEKKITSVYRDH